MKKILLAAALLATMLAGCTQKSGNSNDNHNDNEMKTTLELTQEWDKVFPLSDKVEHKKVTFKTQYGLTLAADLYTPKTEAPLSSLEGRPTPDPSPTGEGSIYSINGQRVKNPAKGIYVKDGKKIAL